MSKYFIFSASRMDLYVCGQLIQTQPYRSRKFLEILFECLGYYHEVREYRENLLNNYPRSFICEFFNLNFNKDKYNNVKLMMIMLEICLCPEITTLKLSHLPPNEHYYALYLIIDLHPQLKKLDLRNVNMRNDQIMNMFKIIIGNCPELTNLNLTSPRPRFLVEVFEGTNLTSFSLDGVDIFEELTAEEVNRWPYLIHLEKLKFNQNISHLIHQDTIVAILKKCPNLRSLRYGKGVVGALRIIQFITRLEKISGWELTESDIIVIRDKCPELRSIVVNYPAYNFTHSLHQLINLTNLELRQFYMEQFTWNISNFGFQLKKLRLFECNLKALPIRLLAEHCQDLKHLELEDILIDFKGINQSFSNLKNLIISFSVGQIYPSFTEVFKFIPALENLELTFWHSLENKDIISTLPLWTNMKLIKIDGSPNLDFDTMMAILRKCRKLKHLHNSETWSTCFWDVTMDNIIRARNSQVCFYCHYSIGRNHS